MVLAFGQRYLVLGIVLLGLALAPALPVRAATGELGPEASQIDAFYTTLLETMKQAEELGIHGRYKKLKPAIERAFDLPGMTALAVGPTWNTMTPDQQRALIDAFTHMTVANYARSFDGYSGQKFEINPKVETRGDRRIVRTALIQKDKEPISLAYLMRQSGAAWKVIDVYYGGNISQIAARRSEFSATLKSGGADALQQKLRELGDRLMTGTQG
jgi:phospholipid transport system substrate-binding protein